MHNHVISLTTANTRRQHITQEFAKHNVAFEFFDAITVSELKEISQRLGLESLATSKCLSPIEKACFLSHVCLWQNMIDQNIKYMAIFEDDIYLGKNTNRFMNDPQWISEQLDNIDIIKLETSLEKVHIGQKEISCNSWSLSRLKSCHAGSASYIITNKGGKALLQYIQSLQEYDYIPIDHILFDEFLSKTLVYQLSPALSIQSTFLESNNPTLTSDIEAERLEYRRIRPKAPRDFKRYFKKIKRSIGKRTFYTTIPFE